MSKITRKTASIFASNVGANQIAKFGSLNAGSPVTYTGLADPANIQALSNWTSGWFQAVEDVNSPAIEDMNAVHFVNSYQVAYLLQAGIAEWDSATTYYIGSLVNNGTGRIYVSLTNNNLNNLTTDPTNWQSYQTFPDGLTANTIVVGGTAGVISNVNNITSGGSMNLKTNGSTTALALDASQNATFSGNITVSGSGTVTVNGVVIGASANSLSNVNNITSGGSMVFKTNGSTTAVTIDAAQQMTLAGNLNIAGHNLINTGTLTFPTATDTLVGRATTDTLTNKTLTSPVFNQPVNNGFTDASSAASGVVGEVITAFSGGGGSPTFTTAAATTAYNDCASITLTAGDWDVWAAGEIRLNTATGLTAMQFGISTTSGNSASGLTSGKSVFGSSAFPTANVDSQFHVPSQPVSVSGSTTYYLKQTYTYTGGLPEARGTLWARRRR